MAQALTMQSLYMGTRILLSCILLQKMLEKEKKQHSFPSAYLTALFTRWVHVIRIE